jgi:hypothetical protein
MPFVTPGTVVAGGVLTAARYNSDVVANTQYLNDETEYLKNEANAVGLVLVTTQSFTASSAVSVNNCFSSNYTNYRVILRCTSAAGDPNLSARLRVGGVDNSTASSYLRQLLQGSSTTASAARDAQNVLALGALSTAVGNVFILDIVSPFAATRTSFLSNNLYVSSTDNAFVVFINAVHNQSISYDGITFFPGSSTITGSFSVYGYKD